MSFFRKPCSLRAACAAALALLACAAALPAQAGAYTFSNPNSQRTINAGVVLLDSTISTGNTAAGPDNPDPYVFYILSRRIDLLPVGWTIQNPLAAHNVAADIQKRWTARAQNPMTGPGATFVANNGGQAYQFGQNETPGMAAYWEVALSTASTQDLQQFDVLLVDLANGDIGDFRPTEVEKLRRFVDGGGTLLVEDSGVTGTSATPGGGRINLATGSGISYGPLFFPLQFQGPSGGAAGTASLPSLAYRHPILNVPYYLAQNELNALGSAFTGDVVSAASPEFTPVLADSAGNKVVAAESFGAGAIVVSSTGFVAGINNAVTAGSIPTASGPNSGPYCGTNFQAAPTNDLKFLCNIISWVGGHGHEHQNSHQTGETLSALPSPVRSWNFTPITNNGTSNVPGATISGNFVYSTDSAGTLHAFDLYPYEDLDGDGYPDDGTIQDYSIGKSCDEVWNASVGTNPSSPTVATPPPVAMGKSGTAYVFVESRDGTIKQYTASSMSAQSVTFNGPSATGPFTTTIPPITGTGTGLFAPAPAPTYYEGRLYASEPDGTLYVKDFGASGSATGGISVKLTAPAPLSGAAIPTGAPAVGGIASTGVGDAVTPQSTDNVAMVPTNSGLFSLFLGARGEQLQGTTGTFTANHVPGTATIDAAAAYRAYSLPTATAPANGYATLEGTSGPPVTGMAPSGKAFTGTPTSIPVYADYDVTFDPAVSLTRSIVTFGGTPSGTEIMSTPALDRFGNASYFASEPGETAYQTLASFHDATRNPVLIWRFRLPASADATAGQVITDADGTNYSPLEDMNFQGKPVADSRGFVYALASVNKGGVQQTAILCFNSQAPITTAPLGLDASTASLTQTEFGGASTPLLSTQYAQNGIGGPLTLTNFGATTNSQPAVLAPNLNEPQPIIVTAATTANANVGQQELLLHTNLVWYSILKADVTKINPAGSDIAVTAGEGITKVGSTLFFVGDIAGGTGSHLYSVPTDPQAAGYAIASKYVDAAQMVNNNALVSDGGDTGAGATSAIASGANGALIINGANGISAFLNRTTLVTDSTRVMELNQDGTASWLADSTQGSIGQGTTSLEFSRPSSVTELTPNDYLVADTGNNRCVRFDRAGKVVWELSRFADTYGAAEPLVSATAAGAKPAYGKTGPLLSASEPNTLNQPTSVQIRQSVETDGTNNYTVVHYLVSDTGNFRILDIVDVYDATGKPVGTPHNLVWISHTHDQQHRDYRYQSAAYFTAANGTTSYIAALVTNQRVAQPPVNPVTGSNNPANGTLSPAAQDAPGGSLVLLDYLPTGVGKNGYIATVIDHVQAYVTNTGAFDLATALQNAGAPTPDFTGTTTSLPTLRKLYLRNPRFLKAYTPNNSNAKGPNLLLADDNGVFDLIYDAGTPGVGGRPPQYFTQWGFTQTDYQKTPLNPVTNPVLYNRNALPFVPQSIQRTATDQVIIGAGTYSIGRYLITNGFSKGDPNNLTDLNAFGGEVFELSVTPVPTGSTNVLETDITNPLSRISNTGPLAQPTFAYRLQ